MIRYVCTNDCVCSSIIYLYSFVARFQSFFGIYLIRKKQTFWVGVFCHHQHQHKFCCKPIAIRHRCDGSMDVIHDTKIQSDQKARKNNRALNQFDSSAHNHTLRLRIFTSPSSVTPNIRLAFQTFLWSSDDSISFSVHNSKTSFAAFLNSITFLISTQFHFQRSSC